MKNKIKNIIKKTDQVRKNITKIIKKELLNCTVTINQHNKNLTKINYKKKYQYNLSIIQQKNPFVLIRKNYKKFYKIYINKAVITPNLYKFIHTLHWPKNTDYFWRNINLAHPLVNIQKNQIIAQQQQKTNMESFLNLIFRKNNIQRLMEFTNIRNSYINKLKKLYISNYANKYNFKKIQHIQMPEFIERFGGKSWKEYFMLSFRQKSIVRTLIRFYYPLTSILIKDKTIHSLPLKTKKPRRV